IGAADPEIARRLLVFEAIPPLSSALPRRDSFPSGHQVPEYSCVVLLVPGIILGMPPDGRAAPKSRICHGGNVG
ncbi:MAG: hypothetical protein WBZ16_09680, partial [Pseudolabrys sp.]